MADEPHPAPAQQQALAVRLQSVDDRRDDVTFEEYVAARFPQLVRFATVLCGDAHSAEDLVQSALIKTFRNWRKVSDADHPDAYVRRIIVTTHISSSRRRRVVETLRAVLPDRAGREEASDPAHDVVSRDSFDRALSSLPARQRSVLILRHYAGYRDDEIAAVFGCREVTVRAYASKAGAALREELRREDQQAYDEHEESRT